ncbi:MAG TPA: cupin domain-containing protein [Candidatus Acidoferrum sp.]|nr:cupin domain-containing protein [Candidatus Acidoferrum sp.]
MPVEQTSLSWLISPIASQTFFEEYWEKRVLVVNRNQPGYFSPLLSLDEADRVITTHRHYPDITVKNADRPVTADDYVTRGNSVDVAKVYQLFEKGSTIILSYLDTVVPTLESFCRSLEDEFSFPFQTNVYLTPASAKGFKPHYDTHDVFVLQVVGSKHWTIYGTPVQLPLAEQDFDSAVHERGASTLEFELEAGDVAYIPRGLVHDARSGDSISLHITAGILSYTWTDLLLEWLANACLNDQSFRKSLPPGFARPEFDRQEARQIFGTLSRKMSGDLNFEEVLDRFIGESLSARPPQLRGQMAQIKGLDHVGTNSVITTRRGVSFRLGMDGASTWVDCGGRRISFPSHVTEALRFALRKSKFSVCELPGTLDEAGKLVLVRRLIREGLLLAVH